ncbi:tellurite resistance/C4-dicarboxylate transporter family protein [Rhodococcus artemisiae]|uniref:Tellurite resistance/C4-dicarboxylate transporter family protein n=1 Tax=Rhodococcus artemisiae TaxID=714159 RepID=A0ABU7LB82_9NOCA|nr:tellurite resistance/C4-dicarboxylate transporter family protein [Rhodococcus artemisiae]MEE2058798.1 tellurite resistance/C4-dicarboxylate transporter family protein [Rhodococcus artemisiae]
MKKILTYIHTMPPSVFAFVMATGVVSVGMHAVDRNLVSLVLWVCAGAGWLTLLLLLCVRTVTAPDRLRTDLGDPHRAFGFFTLVAGTCVVGIRFAVADLLGWAVALWLFGLALWLVLGYAVPWLVVLRDHHLGRTAAAEDTPGADPDLIRDIDGTWFVWVVAMQSVAVLAAMLQPHLNGTRDLVAVVAVIGWGAGLGLYAVVGAALVVRVLRYGVPVNELGPSFWVVMGALAISTLASGHLHAMAPTSPAASAVHGAAGGAALALWGFATWLVPGLLLMGTWRHLRRHVTIRYTTELWAMVFPMGVYSVASTTVGGTLRIPLIDDVGRVFIWVALTAWVCVAVDFLVRQTISRTNVE